MVCTALADEGFDVVGAPDGYQALRVVADGRPDVILLDLGLPFMDGVAFVEHWRDRVPPEERVPIVAVSALPHGDRIAHEARVDEFLAKPLDVEQLVLTVQRLTGGAAVR
jgi:two-component system KDP operon response regulator KdpE